jgi:hypothetical protein
MTELDEDAAVAAVARAVRRLFAVVTEAQARELGRAVLRDLAREGLVLARYDGGSVRGNAACDPSPRPPPAREGGER